MGNSQQIDTKGSKSESVCSKITSTKKINDDFYFITSICLTKDNRLALSTFNKVIMIYNLKNYHCDLTLKGHEEVVNHVCTLKSGNLVSSSRDKTLKIWEITQNNYHCLKTLIRHKSQVYKSIELNNELIASCSEDNTIKIWNQVYPFSCVKTIECDANSIIQLKNKKYIVSCGSHIDQTLKFFDTSNYKCVKSIPRIYCYSKNGLIELDDHRIVVGTWSKVFVINSVTFQLEAKLTFVEDKVEEISSFLKLSNGNLLAATGKGDLIELDMIQYRPLGYVKRIHRDNITGLLSFNNGKSFISCSYDKTIKIWEY